MAAAAPAEISAPPTPRGSVKPKTKPMSEKATEVMAEVPREETNPIAIALGAPSLFAESRVARLMKMKFAPMPKRLISDREREMRKSDTRDEHWKNITSYFWLSVFPFSERSKLLVNTWVMEMLSEKSPEKTKVKRGVSNIIVSELRIVARLIPAEMHS